MFLPAPCTTLRWAWLRLQTGAAPSLPAGYSGPTVSRGRAAGSQTGCKNTDTPVNIGCRVRCRGRAARATLPACRGLERRHNSLAAGPGRHCTASARPNGPKSHLTHGMSVGDGGGPAAPPESLSSSRL